ncbi:MAG: hypothetical protein AB7I04_20035 [Pseudomonadales bacterium]
MRETAAGCTSIDVSVPCSTCRLGCTAARTGARALLLPARQVSGDPGPGDRVLITADASDLTWRSSMLFGPVLGWALCAALLPAASWVGAAATGAGLAVSLLIGHRLVRGGRRPLDVRAEVGHGIRMKTGAIES